MEQTVFDKLGIKEGTKIKVNTVAPMVLFVQQELEEVEPPTVSLRVEIPTAGDTFEVVKYLPEWEKPTIEVKWNDKETKCSLQCDFERLLSENFIAIIE